jgi:hypothetical protein
MTKALVWVAHCKTCGEELERCTNGGTPETAARDHIIDHPGHVVLMGIEIT